MKRFYLLLIPFSLVSGFALSMTPFDPKISGDVIVVIVLAAGAYVTWQRTKFMTAEKGARPPVFRTAMLLVYFEVQAIVLMIIGIAIARIGFHGR